MGEGVADSSGGRGTRRQRDDLSNSQFPDDTLCVAFAYDTIPPSRIFQIPGGKPTSSISTFSGVGAPPSGISSSELDPLDITHSFLPGVFIQQEWAKPRTWQLRFKSELNTQSLSPLSSWSLREKGAINCNYNNYSAVKKSNQRPPPPFLD